MFRKILAATTTALVAGALTFGAVAAPAFADGSDPSTTTDPTTTSSTSTTDSTTDPAPAPADPAPATDPAPASPTDPTRPAPPAADPTPSVAGPAATTEPAATAPALQGTKCLPPSAVSYTYDNTFFDGSPANQGDITVHQLDPTVYSDTLCYGFWVLAAGWQYEGLGTWPQTLEGTAAANNGQEITKVGTYPYHFGYPVTCGQGDVYASYRGPIELPHELTGSSPDVENFLSQMGFVREDHNPNDTWMATDPSCHVVTPVAPQVTAQATCDAPGHISWTDIDGKISYALTKGDGKTGINEVTATALGNWIFPDGSTTHVFKHLYLGTPEDCPATPGDPSSSPAVCTDGVLGNGTISVDLQPGVLEYTLTAPGGKTTTITQATTSVPAGAYTVHVTALAGHVLADNPAQPWTVDGNGWVSTVTVDAPTGCQLPTDADFSIDWTSTNAQCAGGAGTITVGPAEFAGFVNFFIDGKPVTPGVAVKAAAGDHIVSATPADPADTVDNSPQTATVKPSGAVCPTQLKTLALTGTDASAPLIAAGVLLPAGVLMLLGAALIRRRRAQQ